MHARVGLVTGAIGAVLLFVVQPLTGLAALILVVFVGLLAGLSVAKWLPRDWFGRQFEAGLRTGTLACAMATMGFLVSLAMIGKHGIAALAATSHLLFLDLGSVVRTLGVAGWAGVGCLCAVLAFGSGAVLAALAAQLGGWDKNREAILAVERAREAAQRSARLSGVGVGRPSSARVTIPTLSAPALSTPPPSGSSDLSGLNESFHSMRSPISLVPPPAPETPPAADSADASFAPPGLAPTTGPQMIDAASLVDSDPGATSAGMAIPPGAETWSAFATWSESEPAPAPAPSLRPAAPTAEPAHGEHPSGGILLERDPRDGDEEEDSESPSVARRSGLDTDSWLC